MNASLFSTGERVTGSGPVANCEGVGIRSAAYLAGNLGDTEAYERNYRHGCHGNHGVFSSGSFQAMLHNVHDAHKGAGLRRSDHFQASSQRTHVHDAASETTMLGANHVQASPHRTFSVHSACGCGGQQAEPLRDHDHLNVDEKAFWHSSSPTINGNQTGHLHNVCERGCCGPAVMQVGRSSGADGTVSGMRHTSSSTFPMSGEFQRNAAAVGCMAHLQTAPRDFVNRSSSPQTTSMANPQFSSASSKAKKQIILYGWFLMKPSGGNFKNTNSSTFPVVAVGGYMCPRMQKPDFYETAPVIQRLERWRLRTSDGLDVGLMGMIDVERSVSNGFSPALVQCFMIGFPSAWIYMILNLNSGPSKGSNLGLPSQSASPSISQDIKSCLKNCHGLSDNFPPEASAVQNILRSPLFAVADECIRMASVAAANTFSVRDGDSSDMNSARGGLQADANAMTGTFFTSDADLPHEVSQGLREHHNTCPDSTTGDEDLRLRSQNPSTRRDCPPPGLVRDQFVVPHRPQASVASDCAPCKLDEIEVVDVQIPGSSGQIQTTTEPRCGSLPDLKVLQAEDAGEFAIGRDSEQSGQGPGNVSEKQRPEADASAGTLGEPEVVQHEDGSEGCIVDCRTRNESDGAVLQGDLILNGEKAGLHAKCQATGPDFVALLQECIPCTPLQNPRKRLRGDAINFVSGKSTREPVTSPLRTAPNLEMKRRLRSHAHTPVTEKFVVEPAVDPAASFEKSDVDVDTTMTEAEVEADGWLHEAEEMGIEPENSSPEIGKQIKEDIDVKVRQSWKGPSKTRASGRKKRRSHYYQSAKKKANRRKDKLKSAEPSSSEERPAEDVGYESEESGVEKELLAPTDVANREERPNKGAEKELLAPTDVAKRARRSNKRAERSAGITKTKASKCTTPHKPVSSRAEKDDPGGERPTKKFIVPPLPLPRVPDKSDVTEAFGLTKSSRGRVIVPPLATWRRQSIHYDMDGGIIAISTGFESRTTESSTGFKVPSDKSAKVMQRRLSKAAEKSGFK